MRCGASGVSEDGVDAARLEIRHYPSSVRNAYVGGRHGQATGGEKKIEIPM